MKWGNEDWEFWIHLISETNKRVLQLDYSGFYYRRYRVDVHSRSNFLNKNIYHLKETKWYIFEKHISLYKKHFPPAQDFFYLTSRIEQIQKEIKTNLFTRILYRVILFISKKAK